MGMFAISGQADHGFGLEVYFQAILPEDLLNQGANHQFIVGGLQSIGKFPVDFALLADMVHPAGLIDVGLDTAHFLVAHFRPKAVLVKHDDRLLKGGSHRPTGTLPVLLLHDLRGTHLGNVSLFQGSLHPEFQLRSAGELDVYHIPPVNVLQT